MRKIIVMLFLSLFMMSMTNLEIVEDSSLLKERDLCEQLAVEVYYATLDQGGSWQEANENHFNALESCCTNYPNDCQNLIVDIP